MNAAERYGRYEPQNHGRFNTVMAAQRWIAELAEARRITRGQKLLLDELAKHVDAKGKTQKSIAFLARRCATTERTVQRYLRQLCPSKASNPEGWATRVLTRRFIHAVPEPGRKADNVPSWFTLEIPERFFAPKAPRRAPSKLSPGGGEIVTQAVILVPDQDQISETLHTCSNLAREPRAAEPERPPLPPEQAAPTPRPPPSEGAPAALVALCARLFPSHAPIAARAVARLAALGWPEKQIAAYLRRASSDRSLATNSTRHPLLTAVWLAEKRFRAPPPPPKPPDETPPPPADVAPGHANAPPVAPELASRIERARAALAAAEAKTGTKRRLTAQDSPEYDRGGDNPKEKKP